MTRKKLNKVLHKWLSIPLGLIITIICLTGAILIFQQEILELSNPSHYFVDEVKEAPIPLDELVSIVNNKLENNTVAYVKVTDDPQRTYTMSLAQGFRVSVFVNPYTGEQTGRYAVKEHPFFQVMSLHRWLLDSTRTWGKQVVGWTTVFFIVILITGFCYVSRKSKEKYKIHLNKGTRRAMFGLHNALGAYAAIVLLICAFSGLMWSFVWFRNGVFAICGAEKQVHRAHGQEDKKEKKPEINFAYWQTALDGVKKLAPDKYDCYYIEDGMIEAHPKSTYRGRVLDHFLFEKNNGDILKEIPFEDQEIPSRVWAWAYSLHVGDYWGNWSKAFTLIFCLIGASLPLSGYYLSIKKWKNRKKRFHKK